MNTYMECLKWVKCPYFAFGKVESEGKMTTLFRLAFISLVSHRGFSFRPENKPENGFVNSPRTELSGSSFFQNLESLAAADSESGRWCWRRWALVSNAGHRASGLRIIITRREVIPIRPATLPVRRRGASQERSSLGCPEGDAGPK